ncbi:glycosyltransferase [Rhizobium sp. AAP116]|uniref:CgeB family protein n=1 Tax=Rhizobium sp. AAP116 TaxID=1523429 RepID=UPI000A44DD4D|nr:glycosyltransferase [Rhizobium sp. AAP116]
MKILLCCMMHAYGDPKREKSYEYFNFWHTLVEMGHEVEVFDYMDLVRKNGKETMNFALRKKAEEFRPDLAIFSLYTDQFYEQTIEYVRRITKTFCFFHDDTWRVEYSHHWAKYFDFFSSPDPHARLKYDQNISGTCLHFPFGCNESLFRRDPDTKKEYDVSFVGTWHPWRAWLIERLRKAGVKVYAAGFRWKSGEVSQSDMIDVFNRSKINLNLSNSASWDLRYLISSPRAFASSVRSHKIGEQLKARLFEVAGCGGFQLSYYVEGLPNCYEIDKEVVIYTDPDDLLNKVRFYLKHDDLRNSIAEAGYRRTLREHTFKRRFEKAFQQMGLANA